jgi:Domain of unknown function (DUF4136)
MKRYVQTALLAAALMGTATAFAGNVQTDYNHSADFSQYKTYSWGKVKTTDPFFVTRVQNAVNQQLQAKGWTLAPTGGSVTVFATDNIHDQQEIQTMYDGLGGGWGGGWGWGGWGWGGGWGPGFGSGVATTTTTNQNVGNLVIDLFEGSSKQILWRGIATENLSSNDAKNTKQLDQDIAKMFKTFPPKPGK